MLAGWPALMAQPADSTCAGPTGIKPLEQLSEQPLEQSSGQPVETRPLEFQERPKGQVELFAGADLLYRNIVCRDLMFDLVLSLTPAVKWHPGKDWIFSVQGVIPVVNRNYGEAYSYVRLGATNVSKEFAFGRHCVKLTGGLFTQDRFGFDAKWEWAATDWFAIEAQAGLTGRSQMLDTWAFSPVRRVTGILQAKFYLEKWQTEFRLVGGRYIYEDYGVSLQWIKHFNNWLSISAIVQWGNVYGTQDSSQDSHLAGKACIVMMLPWQGQKSKKFKVRPASNFRLTYDTNADAVAIKMYATDPEENERTGNFANSRWGFAGTENRAKDAARRNEGRAEL